MLTRNQRLLGIALIAALILLIPLIAMQFTNEVNWAFSDFLVAGGLLFGAGLLVEFVVRKVKQSQYRLLLIMGVIVAFLLLWAELAVGIFGTPLAGS
jgi:ABC-type cobalt transport system substrate-binding protein